MTEGKNFPNILTLGYPTKRCYVLHVKTDNEVINPRTESIKIKSSTAIGNTYTKKKKISLSNSPNICTTREKNGKNIYFIFLTSSYEMRKKLDLTG